MDSHRFDPGHKIVEYAFNKDSKISHLPGHEMSGSTGNPKEGKVAIHELEALSREGAELMKVLSHETRLAIVFLVAETEMTVTEIQDALRLPQATISQQLSRLRREKVVVGRRRGRSVRYVAHSEKLGPVLKALRMTFIRKD